MEVDSESLYWNVKEDAKPVTADAMELKLGSLVTLLLLTLVSGLAPLFLFRRQGYFDASGTRRKALSFVSCFSGGVFFATCLLDMLPEYLASFNDALHKIKFELHFPLQHFILAMGFFLVLILEQIVLNYKDQLGSSEEANNFLRTDGHVQHPGAELTHVHIDLNSHSGVRIVILVFSLSLHSVLEGLVVGMLRENGNVLGNCLALLIHKCIISFSLTLKLSQGRLRARAMLISSLLFSLMSPLGIGLGVALTAHADPLHELSLSVLKGIATGTFLYITFLEILPHELSSSEQRVLKVGVLLGGFSVITGILFIKI